MRPCSCQTAFFVVVPISWPPQCSWCWLRHVLCGWLWITTLGLCIFMVAGYLNVFTVNCRTWVTLNNTLGRPVCFSGPLWLFMIAGILICSQSTAGRVSGKVSQASDNSVYIQYMQDHPSVISTCKPTLCRASLSIAMVTGCHWVVNSLCRAAFPELSSLSYY